MLGTRRSITKTYFGPVQAGRHAQAPAVHFPLREQSVSSRHGHSTTPETVAGS